MPLLDSFTVDHTRMEATSSPRGEDHEHAARRHDHRFRPALLRAQ